MSHEHGPLLSPAPGSCQMMDRSPCCLPLSPHPSLPLLLLPSNFTPILKPREPNYLSLFPVTHKVSATTFHVNKAYCRPFLVHHIPDDCIGGYKISLDSQPQATDPLSPVGSSALIRAGLGLNFRRVGVGPHILISPLRNCPIRQMASSASAFTLPAEASSSRKLAVNWPHLSNHSLPFFWASAAFLQLHPSSP